MICRICGEIFYIKRGLLDLFKSKEEYICNKCYKKYPLHLRYEVCQLDKYNCVILPMFDKKYNIDYNAFIKEYSKIFIANLYREGFTLFFFNHIDLSIDDTLEALDAISKLVNSNLIILCLSLIK
ncbi:hypothetical protein EI71_01462 [Anaeroplasma bactoclasticum]|jgi:hypothetical protein|uniref:Uncharacterized protein n=1 Tax=Anaeroplasma bactoclasticum TaxID=2088 RepID=A0A397RTM6_9MOLU|nr:hypothetical protein [Anaeroplasma bactoclasticum]RIA75495.1 hypothetical protein EI71_01462 [Anaeroplasma bactoclasticum]